MTEQELLPCPFCGSEAMKAIDKKGNLCAVCSSEPKGCLMCDHDDWNNNARYAESLRQRVAALEEIARDASKRSCKCNVPPFTKCLSCRASKALEGK
jgi:hypothetical protein